MSAARGVRIQFRSLGSGGKSCSCLSGGGLEAPGSFRRRGAPWGAQVRAPAGLWEAEPKMVRSVVGRPDYRLLAVPLPLSLFFHSSLVFYLIFAFALRREDTGISQVYWGSTPVTPAPFDGPGALNPSEQASPGRPIRRACMLLRRPRGAARWPAQPYYFF